MSIRALAKLDIVDILNFSLAPNDPSWSKGALEDVLNGMRQGTYLAHVRVDDITGRIMGYVVASYLFEQADVQNIIVSQADRGQGVGRALLQVLTKDLACHGVENIFLEVRPSNQAAVSLYQSAGFVLMQKRRGYYPLVSGLREDAWVFSLTCL